MSTLSTINAITAESLRDLPAVIAAVHAAEAIAPPGTTGQQKHDAVVAAITTGAGTLAATNPNQTVAAVSSLVALSVTIANLLGAFKHKEPEK